MPYIRVIRYRWLPGYSAESARLARALSASVAAQAGSLGVRVLSALDGGGEGLVVFEWETREALSQHLTAASLERLAPWAVPLLHWRTDQAYEVLPADSGQDTRSTPGESARDPS
jgi:quinol monooxygenase YgiN